MQQRTVAFLGSALLAFCVSSAVAQTKGPKGGVPGGGWLSSLQEGKLHAGKTGKPIMVVLRCQP